MEGAFTAHEVIFQDGTALVFRFARLCLGASSVGSRKASSFGSRLDCEGRNESV